MMSPKIQLQNNVDHTHILQVNLERPLYNGNVEEEFNVRSQTL